MAYNDNRGGYNGNGYNRGYGGQGQPQRQGGRPDFNRPAPPAEIRPEKVPADYVDQAESVMRDISQQRDRITTSKIRNLLSLISDIYNTEKLRSGEKDITGESASKLSMMRVRTAYEAGRDNAVKLFVEKAKLLGYIKGIGTDREDLLRFANYMEALVAYHRYFGGKD